MRTVGRGDREGRAYAMGRVGEAAGDEMQLVPDGVWLRLLLLRRLTDLASPLYVAARIASQRPHGYPAIMPLLRAVAAEVATRNRRTILSSCFGV